MRSILPALICLAAVGAALQRPCHARTFTADDCTGSPVATSDEAGSIAVAGQDVLTVALECIFTIGSPGATTRISNLAEGGDPGWSWFELYDGPSIDDPSALVLRLLGLPDFGFQPTAGPLFVPPNPPLQAASGFFTFHFVSGAPAGGFTPAGLRSTSS